MSYPTQWTVDVQNGLAAPFPEDEIEFLPRAISQGQQGCRALALAHIDARAIMRRLDAVVGPGNWSFTYDVVTPDGKKVRGELTVLGVTKCDAGEAKDEAEPLKSAVSDALKRCGVHFGIGRFLYYLPTVWADYDQQRKRFTNPPQIPAGAMQKALAVCGYTGSTLPSSRQNARQNAPDGQEGASAPKQDAPPRQTPGQRYVAQQVPSPEYVPDKAGQDTDPFPISDDEGDGMHCVAVGCGVQLTQGQHDLSMRAFLSPLCPSHQRSLAKARAQQQIEAGTAPI